MILTNARSAVISEGLAPYVRDLAKNADNYPEMQQELTQEAQERVARIAEHLLTVPLLHAYHDPNAIGSIREHGLLSHSATPSEGGMTHRLDKSLELDKYSFWTWGQLLDDRFGGNVIAVDAATVLLGNTIVTPRDIASSVTRENQHRDYQDFDDAAKERVTETYFQKVVHGKDWLQIVAAESTVVTSIGPTFR